MGEDYETRVECQDCNFATVVSPDEDRLPADVVVEHGRESGHKLAVHAVER
jgi:hypothetical protein